MKGIIFNLLEEIVIRRHGEAAWDECLDAAGLDGAYTSLGSYPDGELETLVGRAADILGVTRGECLRWFGREAMPLLAARYPAFFNGHHTTLSFILSVNSIIHPEVRKIHPGAHCPVFRFEHSAGGGLLLGYDSPRRLCSLAHGFIEGAAGHFGERAEVQHLRCVANGDPDCLLAIHMREPEASDVDHSAA